MMRERLALAIAVVGFLALAGWGIEAGYLAPTRSSETQAASLAVDLDQVETRLARARSELAINNAKPVPPTGTLLDIGPAVSASSERLQGAVRSAVAASGGQTLSSQTGTADLSGGYTKIALLLRARFDEAGLLAFLRQVESETPVIVVDELDVQQLSMPGDSRQLDVTASLFGVHADVDAH